MAALVKGKNVDVSKVSFSVPRALDNGSKLVYVNYNGSRFNVQTPWMYTAWDMNCYSEGAYPKYSVELSFKGMDDSPDMQQFHDNFIALEQKIINGGVDNGTSWLKLKKELCTEAVVSSKFGPIIKPSKDKETGEPDGKWPSTMKLKIGYRDDKFEGKFFRKDGTPINVNGEDPNDHLESILVKGSRVRGIIQCVGLWCAGGNYMCQWKLDRCEVEVPDSAAACSFLPDSDGEDENVDLNRESMDTSNGPRMLDDSDDEADGDGAGAGDSDAGGDSEVEAEEPSTPEPAPVKKTPPTAPKKIKKRKVVKGGN